MSCASFPSPQKGGSSQRPELSEEQKQQLFRGACRRVAAAVRRAPAPSCRELLGPAADIPVYGAFVTLKRGGRLRSCCGHIGASLPLSEAVDRAADRAATDDPRFPPITSAELDELDVDVWLLWGPRPIQARGEERVAAVEIGKHGLQIARGHARGLLLPGVAVEHNLDARAFLQQVCLKAGLPIDAWKDDDVELQVFEGEAVHGHIEVEIEDERLPAVAGGFYPATPKGIQRMLDEMFAPVSSAEPEPWAGVLAPHAGWIYSGSLAAAVYSRVKMPECAIIFAPKHRPYGARWAVAPHRRWLFPGGTVESDYELAKRLAGGISGLEPDSVAHRDEHAVEVHLPLLARLAPKMRIVGVVVGDASLHELLGFGVGLSMVLRELPQRPLLIISSDMNHFADDVQTRHLDRLALDAIATLNPEQVYETVRRNRISMCGLAPCVVVMEALRWLGCLKRCEIVGYATSADAGGPKERVVGYAGVLFN